MSVYKIRNGKNCRCPAANASLDSLCIEMEAEAAIRRMFIKSVAILTILFDTHN